MKISVITAVYNRESTIAQAIASVRDQVYPDVEHIIIDGASSDGTLAEVERCRTSRMQIISEPDSGIYDAINKGVSLATGDVIGLMHSDDFFADARVLEKVAAAFDGAGVDAVYGDLQYVSANDPGRVIRYWRSGHYGREKLRRGWMPPHPTLFLRREVFERLGGYDTNYRISADYDAILRYFGKGGVVPAYVPQVLVKMRVGGESNKSLNRIFLKSVEDLRALRANKIGGMGTLVLKNLRKLGQFLG